MGTGYSQTNPPPVLVGTNELVRESVRVNNYRGDGGVLVGIGITTIMLLPNHNWYLIHSSQSIHSLEILPL